MFKCINQVWLQVQSTHLSTAHSSIARLLAWDLIKWPITCYGDSVKWWRSYRGLHLQTVLSSITDATLMVDREGNQFSSKIYSHWLWSSFTFFPKLSGLNAFSMYITKWTHHCSYSTDSDVFTSSRLLICFQQDGRVLWSWAYTCVLSHEWGTPLLKATYLLRLQWWFSICSLVSAHICWQIIVIVMSLYWLLIVFLFCCPGVPLYLRNSGIPFPLFGTR